MKIKFNRKRAKEKASGLLVFIVVTMAMFIGGCATYNLVKWAKRVDSGQIIPRPGFTNEESIVIPPGEPSSSITAVEFRDPHVWFEWVEFDDDNPMSSAVSTTLLSAPSPSHAPTVTTNKVIAMSLDAAGNLLMKIFIEVGSQNQVTFADLGMPVDAYGMPSDLSWGCGTVPTGDYQTWELQISTNTINWEPIVTEKVYPSLTNRYYDQSQIKSIFYRAVRIR